MSHMFSYIWNMPKIQAKIYIGNILKIVYTFDSFLLQSDGKQGRDEQVGQHLTNRRNEIMKRRKMMMISIFVLR